MESKKICRLCLQVIPEDGYEVIDTSKRKMIREVVPKIDLIEDLDLKMCKACSDKTVAAYKFKHNFLESNSHVFESRITLPADSITHMEQIDFIEYYEDCSFCQKIVDRSNLLPVPSTLLEQCFLNVRAFDGNFKSCEQCLRVLEDFCAFSVACIRSTQKIKEYCSLLEVTLRDVVLYEIHQFLSSPSISLDAAVHVMSPIKSEGEDNQASLTQEAPEFIGLGKEPVKLFDPEDGTKHTQNLREHKNLGKVTFKCQKGLRQTEHKNNLNTCLLNRKSCTNRKIFKCEECLYQSNHKNDLNKHSLVHKNPSGVKMFTCQHCSLETKLRRSSKRHLLLHKNSE